MADVTFQLNGKTLKAPAGTLLIEAARQNGVEIPAFCYYPGLSLQAACRMCLVDIEKRPKLATACTEPVMEGMVVWSDNEKIHKARKGTLEFLLTNHPLDCPVCDKGGECELQDMVFRYGASGSRFVEEKLHVPEQKWSPVVYYDAPRCILCYRCIRVCNEGMGVGALGLSYRGVNSEIVPNKGDHLECEECGMCIDICPVGALTSGAYRYHTRPWEMNYVATPCAHCGDGCKVTLSVRNNQIMRGNNRDQSGLNGDFLCIKGRYAYDFTHHPERITKPRVRKNGELVECTWTEAIAAAAAGLRAAKSHGVIGSTHTTNEENYFLQKFARQGLKTPHIDHRRSADFPALMDALAGRPASPSSLATSRDVLEASAVLLIGNNPTDQHPMLAWNIRTGVRLRKQHLYIVNRAQIPLFAQAAAAKIVAAGEEIAALDAFKEALGKENDIVVIFGSEIKGADVKKLVAFGDTLPGSTRYIALADNNNSRGAVDMGVLPDLGPGYQPVETPGMALDEMIAANLEALYVIGANPARRYAMQAGRSFLVVQDMFLTETAKLADVVLPSANAYEKAGTVTNTFGEVQRMKQGLLINGAKTDLDILSLVARALGFDLGATHPATQSNEVFEEIRRTVKGYNISTATLLTGSAVPVVTLNGAVPHSERPDLIVSSNDTLFTSGSLGRYCSALSAVAEAKQRTNPEGIGR
jgi:NADH-quinone oxidoreductase subunit G